MTKKLFVPSLILVVIVGVIVCLNGCKKDSTTEPLEPIALIQPDSSIVQLFAGDSLPLEIKFTTDRPINWVRGMYGIDTSGNAVGTFTDSLFYAKLDTTFPRVNLYTYTGVYNIPDSLPPFSTVRFRITFNAGNDNFLVGQNYPPGFVNGEKEFRIDVR